MYERGLLREEIARSGVPIVSIAKRGRWDLVGPGMRLRLHLRRLRPQIIHSFLTPPNILAALFGRRGVTRIVWGYRASDMDMKRYDWTHSATNRLERALASVPASIVANSNAGRLHALGRGYPVQTLRVIPNGIDTQRFRPNAVLRAETRALLGISAGTQLVGIAARLDPMKDHDTFLRAVAIAGPQREPVRFVCVGGGSQSYEAALKERARTLGIAERVLWLGVRNDMPAIWNAIDVATLSSAFGEGFPNAVGEAMACGVPVVATTSGDSADIVGETGIAVPTRGPKALAQGWLTLLAEGDVARANRSAACRARIEQHYSLQAMVSSYSDLYSSLTRSVR